MRSAPGAKRWPVITRRFLITRYRCLILNWRPQRLCKSKNFGERMRDMFYRRIIHTLLTLSVVVYGGCKRASDAPANPPSPQKSAEAAQSHAIETETVAPQPIAGAILATGKILV